ncbi:MAG: DUF2185 domain-containing protein [Polyangiaceae bacterium]|nr:DUF2185 domain-containing protein [Polyangiaceae bacterium]
MSIGWMYREGPAEDVDSGWRFFSGADTEEYVNDPSNMAMFQLDEIARRHPDVIPYLHNPCNTAWERLRGEQTFQEVEGHMEESVHVPHDPPPPKFPIVRDALKLPAPWLCDLPAYFYLREEDGALVLWREGLTMRLHFLFGASGKISKEEALARNQQTRSRHAQNERIEHTEKSLRYSYDVGRAHSRQGCITLVGNVFTDKCWVMAEYQCDDAQAVANAQAVRKSLRLRKKKT